MAPVTDNLRGNSFAGVSFRALHDEVLPKLLCFGDRRSLQHGLEC